MIRWFLLFVLPILSCALIFEAVLVPLEDFSVNFFSLGQSYGAPFVVGVGPRPPAVPVVTPEIVSERFSVLWFAVDVIVTAAIAFAIAWFLRIRNAWVPSVGATALVGLVSLASNSSPPIPIRSFGFSYWIYWIVAFALMSAVWTGLELYRARPKAS